MKQPSPNRSLNGQLMLLGAVPAALMFLGLMLFFTTARLSDARQELYHNTQTLADNLAPALEYAVLSGNNAVLEDMLRMSMKRTELEWIRVTNVVGEELGFVARDGIDTWPGPDENDDSVHRFTSDILQQPLDLANEDSEEWFEPDYQLSSGALRIGSLEMAVSERLLFDRRSDILLTSTVVGVSLLVLSMLLVSRLSAALLEPIHALADRVLDLTHRDYQDPRPVGARVREIAELENNLGQLARDLQRLQESRDQTLALSEGAREKAEAASHAKSEFLAVMSHELRTPLNGVLAMVDLVSDEPLTDRQSDYLHTAKRSTEDLLVLINDILDVSRLDQGKLLLDEGQFEPQELARNCLASFRHIAEQQGLALELRFTGLWPECPQVVGDAARYRQILASLLDNAVKFSDDGTIVVTLDWHQEADDCVYIACEVRDRGRGIPAEQFSQVFNSFEQLDSSHSRNSEGTGIGLNLVQKLIELMGGHIRLTSHDGEGTSFHFEVPFELVDADVSPATVEEIERPSTESAATTGRSLARALVVEDNPVNQRVARTLLDRLGFETVAVNNGQQALDSVTSDQDGYTVILMDCHMPVMDGFEATQSIRDWESRENRRKTPIIALTADALPGTETACREAGMTDYLAKPVRKDQLRTVLSRWVPL